VGAFADGMSNLKERDLASAVVDFIDAGKPFLGICLGMQLLMESSEEFGCHRGLGVVPGQVKRLPELEGLKLPNIGWHELLPAQDADLSPWNETILAGMTTNRMQYFVHSYAAYPSEASHWLSGTRYGDHLFCSTLKKGNVTACQFHPEKSGEAGLGVLEAFLRLD
jgi:glutamine amidotransferase